MFCNRDIVLQKPVVEQGSVMNILQSTESFNLTFLYKIFQNLDKY